MSLGSCRKLRDKAEEEAGPRDGYDAELAARLDALGADVEQLQALIEDKTAEVLFLAMCFNLLHLCVSPGSSHHEFYCAGLGISTLKKGS